MDALNNHLKKGAKYDVDYRHRHKSGEYRWQNSKGQAVFDESGKPTKMVGCISDITERKEMQEKLLTSEKLAVMGRLTADVAHELNNPLAIVIGGIQLVLSRIDEKAQTTFKSQLETVLRNARRCKTILNNLLGYGRTIGKKEEAVNLPDLIREAIDDVNYQYDMSAIETVLNYPGSAEGPAFSEASPTHRGEPKASSAGASSEQAVAEITGNKSALLSVLVNLIRNARQAMGEKGRLTITIEKEDKKHLRIEIHDTGSGISKEQKVKLFQPFASGWKEREGSGLGLATSLGIIETHGGSMSAESEGEGKGATFTILLPCEFKGKK
jgi:signal transduction histidine kinase